MNILRIYTSRQDLGVIQSLHFSSETYICMIVSLHSKTKTVILAIIFIYIYYLHESILSKTSTCYKRFLFFEV